MLRPVLCLALIAAFLLPASTAAAADNRPSASAPDDQSDLCSVSYQLTHLGLCPLAGPGGLAELRQRYELPLDMPALGYTEIKQTRPLLLRTYAKVTTPDAPVFASPDHASAGVVKRTLGRGFIYVSIGRTVDYGGEEFIRINDGEYMRRADLSLVEPSGYQGILLADQPRRSFAWLVRKFQPRILPDGPVNREAPTLQRYDIVQIYAKLHVGKYDWYLVGQDQWVEQRNLGIVDVLPPPEGVTGKWISVNLYEQTMAVYEGERMVYASLVSSGLGAWPTRPGTFQIYARLDNTKMSGAYAADKSDYYFLEDVPWVLYFDRSISFHGTYWHNGYGFRKSHGCVNLSPTDARWLYNWAEIGTTVHVYDPSGETPIASWSGGGP